MDRRHGTETGTQSFFRPVPISFDEICEAQSADDSLQPVMQALKDLVKPPHLGIWEFPEDTRILLSQWDSVLLQYGIFYRKFHYLGGTANFLQIVLPTKIRCPYIKDLHTDTLDGRRLAWQSFAALTFQDGDPLPACWFATLQLATCTSKATRCHAKQHLSPVEISPNGCTACGSGGAFAGRTQQLQSLGFQYIISVIESATRYLWLLPLR